MTQQLTAICKEFGLVENEQPINLNEALRRVYYDWDWQKVMDFMDAIAASECGSSTDMGLGDALFDD